MSSDLMPEELLLVQLVRLALRDARGKDARLSEEARQRLWTIAPAIAQRAEVSPTIASDNALSRR